MMTKQVLSFLVIMLCLSISGKSQQVAKMTPDGIGFLQYLPSDYHSNSKKYPVVISLHGIKEKGNTQSAVAKVANVGLPKYVKYGTKYPFILIAPQLRTNMGKWTGDYIMKVLKYVKTYLRIDSNRIYLTGLSLGGGGVWTVAGSNPSVFAAILPICSGYNQTSKASAISNARVPVWAFHGNADHVVSYNVTVSMVNAINNKGANPKAKLTIFPGMGHVIWDKVYKSTNALDWLLSFRKGGGTAASTDDDKSDDNKNTGGNSGNSSKNVAPVAKAGPDRTITLPTSSISLTGSGADKDGKIVSYSWKKTYGGSVSLSGTSSQTLKASGMKEGHYIFVLTVRDDKGAVDTDAMMVKVKKGSGSSGSGSSGSNSSGSKNTKTNKAPIAHAGPDRVITGSSVAINGSGTDRDGKVVSYSWRKTYGNAVSLSGDNSSTLHVSGMKKGNYIFVLTVRDDKGAVDTDAMKVTVQSSGRIASSSTSSGSTGKPSNKAPVANAGGTRHVVLPTTATAIYGNAHDSDGRIASYVWTKVSGGPCRMTNTHNRMLKLSSLRGGEYVFRLTVKDNDGASATDDIHVVVSEPPVVNAGSDKNITLPSNSVTLTASATDRDGSIKSYLWSKQSGPNLRVSNNQSKSVTLRDLHQGTYVMKLAVKDNDGLVSYDYVTIRVKEGTVTHN